MTILSLAFAVFWRVAQKRGRPGWIALLQVLPGISLLHHVTSLDTALDRELRSLAGDA